MGAPGTTKGEWQALKGVLAGDHILILSDDYAIAKVYVEEEGSEATNEANAAQIAASGALYDALERILETIGDTQADGYVENALHSDEVKVARAALALARGEKVS